MKVASNHTCVLGGKRLTYAKLTRELLYAFIEHENACKVRMTEATNEYREADGAIPRPSYDRYDYYVDLLKFILMEEGSEALDPDFLDMNEAEGVISAFLPESMRLSAMLAGF